MTMKDQAFRAHAFLQPAGVRAIKRSHIHELLAIAAGYGTHAAFQQEATWCNTRWVDAGIEPSTARLRARCLELGYPDEEAVCASDAVIRFLLEQGYAAVSFEALITASDQFEEDPSWNRWVSTTILEPGRRDVAFYFENQPVLLQGLELAASKGVTAAHYAIARLLEAEADTYPAEEERTKRHYRREGVWTSPFVSFDDVATEPLRAEYKYRHHLFEAARACDLRALLESAERFSDPAILNHAPSEGIDPMSMVHLASEHEDDARLRFWLAAAASGGDVDAMRELIVGHDEPIEQAWVWMHLSRLLDQDLSRDHYELVHENADRYDDDLGGPGYVVGDDGIELEPLDASANAVALREAERLMSLLIERDINSDSNSGN